MIDLDDIEAIALSEGTAAAHRIHPLISELRGLRSQLAESQRETERLRELAELVPLNYTPEGVTVWWRAWDRSKAQNRQLMYDALRSA